MMIVVPQRAHSPSLLPARANYRGRFNAGPGLSVHPLASVRQDLSHEHIESNRHRFPLSRPHSRNRRTRDVGQISPAWKFYPRVK